MNCIKGLALLMLLSMASGCATKSAKHPEPLNPILAAGIESQVWVSDEFDSYQNKKGYKAFAVSLGSQHTIVATGFADDKVNKQAAHMEALRMCVHYSQGAGRCVVVDQQDSKGTPGLTQQQISEAPPELIAHRDIIEYNRYQKAQVSKAFVIAACSGQSFWVHSQNNKLQAEKKALAQCELNRHSSDPCCSLLVSE